MPQTYRGKPRSVSRVTLSDGRSAALVPRERKHFSGLQGGYPLVEEFVDYLAAENVDAIVIDDGENRYAFDLRQYRTGNRIGHDPYPMKRVAPLDEATRLGDRDEGDAEREAAEWQWLTDADLQPVRERTEPPSASKSPSRETRDDSISAD